MDSATISQDRFRSWIPHGFSFLNPQDTQKLLELKKKIRGIFQSEGFMEITPPSFDFSATFLLTARESNPTALFALRDRDGENLSLRSDITVQAVKAAANGFLGPDFPKKLSYIQPVFLDRSWGSGHTRETIQAGVELIGGDSILNFSETLKLARRSLEICGHSPRILYGDMRFIESLFRDVPEKARNSLSESFHNKDTARILNICRESNLSPELTEILKEVPLIFGGSPALDRLAGLCRNNRELMEIIDIARKEKDVIYDFSLVHDLSYYTGPVFEGYISSSKEKIISGGVYNRLFDRFHPGGEQRNACGFAFNLSLLL